MAGPGPALSAEDAACWKAAIGLHVAHPEWVVIWVARKNQYQARPTFPAPAGTMLTSATPEALDADIVRFEKRRPPGRTRSRPQDRS